MEKILNEILNKRRVFELVIGEDTPIYRLLYGSPEVKFLFFVDTDDDGDYVFCEAKPSNEITTDDFLKISENDLKDFINQNKVTLW